MHQLPSIAETYEQMLREQEPNFLRLYLNPHVAQTCFCLDHYVLTTWPQAAAASRGKHDRLEYCQSFLANGFEEAISGAIKLARYSRYANGARSTGLVLDPADRLTNFAAAELAGGVTVPFLPGLRIVGKNELSGETRTLGLEDEANNGRAGESATGVNPVVLVASANDLLERHAESIRRLVQQHAPLVITCVDRESFAALRGESKSILREIDPDIVVFDESFVDHAVPWSAFTARKSLFALWNRPAKATFHSTTFQPNTISSLHFMRFLAKADPKFHSRLVDSLQRLRTDLAFRGEAIRHYYNPSLYRLIRATGFCAASVRAAGSFVVVDDRPIFDAVSGVACSFRGHNPATYAAEMETLELGAQCGGKREAGPSPDDAEQCANPSSRQSLAVAEAHPSCEAQAAELGRQLQDLTGLEFFLPAVSGATAVENALKIALVAQFPKRHILVLKAGFGGKTLLALTGTANPSYKERVEPLYGDVHYVDAFAPDAEPQIESLLQTGKFAVVQVELIQAVGGVRPVPQNVIRALDAGRNRWDYLLLVDEVQTGMYRTGSFTLSKTLDLVPDILLLGKATTDMMFPFALTLYSARVRGMLESRGSDLADSIKKRYGYEQGYKTVVNVLRLGESMNMARQVADAAALFSELLETGLASSKMVREVRVFGLLIGIELDTSPWPRRWLHKRLSSFYLFSMLRHERFPVLAGFCQYEPNVLKITPPLNVSPEEIRRACATIVDVLNRPLRKVIAAGLGGLINSSQIGRRKHEHGNDPSLEPAAR
jgi:acetylornithine/succinyldiaminopimelate/putrescine aminotransferase